MKAARAMNFAASDTSARRSWKLEAPVLATMHAKPASAILGFALTVMPLETGAMNMSSATGAVAKKRLESAASVSRIECARQDIVETWNVPLVVRSIPVMVVTATSIVLSGMSAQRNGKTAKCAYLAMPAKLVVVMSGFVWTALPPEKVAPTNNSVIGEAA